MTEDLQVYDSKRDMSALYLFPDGGLVMSLKVFVGLFISVFFSHQALAQIPENVSMEEVYDLCSYATTETQGAQCFPLAWSALNSAEFVIRAVRGEERVDGADLNYHLNVLTSVSRGLLEIGVLQEAEASGLPVEEYVSTMYFLTLTLDEVTKIDASEHSEARMFLYALNWESRLSLFDSQGITPDEFAERREIAEARIEEILDAIFGENPSPEDLQDEEEPSDQNPDNP
jgi:hypothetical protein